MCTCTCMCLCWVCAGFFFKVNVLHLSLACHLRATVFSYISFIFFSLTSYFDLNSFPVTLSISHSLCLSLPHPSLCLSLPHPLSISLFSSSLCFSCIHLTHFLFYLPYHLSLLLFYPSPHFSVTYSTHFRYFF